VLCHLPFLFPLAGLVLFGLLPFPQALAVYAPLTILSLAIGLPAVRAMYRPVQTGSEGMRGKPARVVASAGRSGTVLCAGELWQFRSATPVTPGDRVTVVAVEHLTAVVASTPPRNAAPS
jgi:membrane-bound serine protease (ClpP class)